MLEFDNAHPSWYPCLKEGLAAMDAKYLQHLHHSQNWLPGAEKIFNAFSLPLDQVNYVLFGESPYPRAQSAIGYAFWDGAVHELWSETGLSKKVNRATSLRNLIKMLLVADGYLTKNNLSQSEIKKITKHLLVQTNDALFNNFINHGFLLLNTTLVLQKTSRHQDAKAWLPFMQVLLSCLLDKRPQVQFILFGNIAKKIEELLKNHQVAKLCAEHPYNLSFISNPKVLDFFRPFHLLRS